MDLDLGDFTDAVTARTAQWANAGVRWELHRGPTRDKSAAWIICTTADREAQLTVWTSGEAELDIAQISTGTVTSTHYDMSTAADLTTCLDELTHQLTSAPSGT
ncbi:hypothetical protein [Plantactinospora sp. KLBMP9567]|uniref:hypothetical protein n=1 Tax=Plantactinospora sp. KLBMP9567 TaxID=3085900 RepID=UPI002981D606|nr:hypothetical protein [Plantactinospora sp. KLBMP9567]MDW5325336.1 hypothetical protein [Plantactinospora sp. KLBMP9567]